MHKTDIHPDLANIALEHSEGFPFESFVNSFMSCIRGASFIPMGGVHDGGADGLLSEGVYEIDVSDQQTPPFPKISQPLSFAYSHAKAAVLRHHQHWQPWEAL